MLHTVAHHLVSTLSISVIALNLLFWVCLLIPSVLLGLIPVPPCNAAGSWLTTSIYRAAVWVDSLWLERVLGVRIVLHGGPPDDRCARLVVVSNHRSWFDILVLQKVIVARGPIAKFLIKRELIFVPIVGWICLALRFPRLRRGGDAESRRSDISSVSRFALENMDEPGAVVTFVEGTRFSEEKRARLGSAYRHLLDPRAGGFGVLIEQMREAQVIDLTIVYPPGTGSFWDCIGGSLRRVDVWLDSERADRIGDAGEWLAERWARKDALIARARSGDVEENE